MKNNDVPTSLDGFAEWGLAQAKKQELARRAQELTDERNDLCAKLTDAQGHKPSDQYLDQARQMIGQDGDSSSGEPTLEKLREQSRKVQEEQKVVARAITLQESVIDNLARELPAKLAPKIKPHYTQLVRNVAQAVHDLAGASEELAILNQTLTQNKVNYENHMRPMHLSPVGELRNPNSRANMILNQCVEHGYFKQGEIK